MVFWLLQERVIGFAVERYSSGKRYTEKSSPREKERSR
jgi:hypothetical protein